MKHLFTPMLFTSLTTAAGFASLALTPIPPVRVFGIFVAIGVVLAWLLTILFIPAFLVLLSKKRLEGFGRAARLQSTVGSGPILGWLNRVTYRRAKVLILLSVAAVAGAAFGISKIQINDNPTRWFEEDHPIRVADREMNEHFGGTYDAFLAFEYQPEPYEASRFASALENKLTSHSQIVTDRLSALAKKVRDTPSAEPLDLIEAYEKVLRKERTTSSSGAERAALNACLDVLAEAFEDAEEDETPAEGYQAVLAQRIDDRATAIAKALDSLRPTIAAVSKERPGDAQTFLASVRERLASGDAPARSAAESFLSSAAQSTEVFKEPELLAFIEGMQRHLDGVEAVGKSSSLADIVKTVHRDLLSGKDEDYRLPATASIVAQTLDQYQSSHRKDDLWHFVTPDYKQAVIWLQLKSGDNQQMELVVKAAKSYMAEHSAPVELQEPAWFGLTYINVVWQDQMVSGMLRAFIGSFFVVLFMMIVLFRSVLWGLLSMLPLTLTVAVIYGIIGLVGKDYDMPVAVLSSLSLGLAIDYAIHFLARSRELARQHGSWNAARERVFGEPARAISRNIVVVGVGFLPLLLAPLVPYQTVESSSPQSCSSPVQRPHAAAITDCSPPHRPLPRKKVSDHEEVHLRTSSLDGARSIGRRGSSERR